MGRRVGIPLQSTNRQRVCHFKIEILWNLVNNLHKLLAKKEMKSLSPALCLRASFGYYFSCSPRLHTPLSDLLYGHGLNLISKFAFVSGYAALRFCRYAQIPHKSFEPAHEQLLWTTTTTASALFSLLLLLLLLLFKRGCFGCRFTHQQIVEFIG